MPVVLDADLAASSVLAQRIGGGLQLMRSARLTGRQGALNAAPRFFVAARGHEMSSNRVARATGARWQDSLHLTVPHPKKRFEAYGIGRPAAIAVGAITAVQSRLIMRTASRPCSQWNAAIADYRRKHGSWHDDAIDELSGAQAA